MQGFDEEAFVFAHRQDNLLTSIRINPSKIDVANVDFAAGSMSPVPWCANGYYLSERPSFTADPLLHAGAYYVQEAGSMFLQYVLGKLVDAEKSLRVLDLCAAPGGKSTLLQSCISSDSLLVSNEVIKSRVPILSENITKWGAANVVVTNNDPADFQRLPGFFDVMVVDAPCSGSGLFRKDNAAIGEWSPANVALCSQRQQRILSQALPALKQGGLLIYSTCSYSVEENEQICDWLMDNFSLASCKVEAPKDWGIAQTVSEKHGAVGFRFYPNKAKSEGFFLAAFTKPEGETFTDNFKPKFAIPAKDEVAAISAVIEHINDFRLIKIADEIIAIPQVIFEDFVALQSNLYLKKAGVRLGANSAKGLLPAHDLAMCTLLKTTYPEINLNKELALDFLRKAEFNLDTDVKSWALISYKRLPLGFVKVLHNRVNNYYPKEWRIINK